MAIYKFKGMDRQGRNIHGQVEADSIASAQAMVKKDGIYLVSIQDKAKLKNALNIFSKNVDVKTLAVASRNLSSLLGAGIPLVDSLDTVAKQTEHPVMAEALGVIRESVNAGKSFHQSLAGFPHIFNKTFTTMCEAGEVSGTLDMILMRLTQLIEDQSQTKDKVRSALIYPAVILVFAFFMVIFLLTYVVPKIQVLFEESTAASIPWYSAFLLNLSSSLREYWMSLSVFFIIAVFSFWRWLKSKKGRRIWDHFSLKLPVFGPLIRAVIISRMSRTLSVLLKGGVTLTEALDIVKNVVNNHKFYHILSLARESIERGNNLSTPLIQSGAFPPMVTQMLRVGEKTGQLEKMLSQISETYDNQIKTEISAMTALLEPALLIIMGGIIAFIIFSTMIPMMQMYNISGF